MEEMKKDNPVWEPYGDYRMRKLYLAAKLWFAWQNGLDYKPSEEEMKKLMENPDFIKDNI